MPKKRPIFRKSFFSGKKAIPGIREIRTEKLEAELSSIRATLEKARPRPTPAIVPTLPPSGLEPLLKRQRQIITELQLRKAQK